jgi:hypothetical protein
MQLIINNVAALNLRLFVCMERYYYNYWYFFVNTYIDILLLYILII